MVEGIKLALEQAGNKAGEITVKYESLDDSTAQAGTWTPEATSANARKAAQDDRPSWPTSASSTPARRAVSIPILNEAGVPQISPANTAVGLTTNEPGADKGEPDKYYPTGDRTYSRIVPEGHDPGRRARHAHEGGRLHQGRSCSTTRRSTARASVATSRSPPRSRA